jgi:hypothetical protein
MSFPPLDRRTLIRGGATLGCLALTGFGQAAGDSSPAPVQPLTGALIGWLTIGPAAGGHLTLVQTDARSGFERQIAVETIDPTPAVAGAARQATTMVVRIVAASWGVSPDDCACGWSRIEHSRSGRSVSFAIWTDFV